MCLPCGTVVVVEAIAVCVDWDPRKHSDVSSPIRWFGFAFHVAVFIGLIECPIFPRSSVDSADLSVGLGLLRPHILASRPR